MNLSVLLGAWVAVGLTLAMFSFLYKDNPFFKLGEHLYLGVSVGYTLVSLIFQYMIPKWYDPLFRQGQWMLLIPTLLGLFVLTRLFPKIAWLSRWAFAFIMGFGAGVAIPRYISAYLLRHAQVTVQPLLSKAGNGWHYTWGDFSNLVVIVGVLSILTYFFFSIEHKGVVKGVTRTGILFLMISFGASFGFTVMARVSLLFGRFYDLVEFSSKSYYYATPILLILMILFLIGSKVLKARSSNQ
ncbi:MAG: hypothetical protein V1800_09545 [Candidatus Latescibacterota bacterium]